MKARTALSIQRDVIFAIFLREMNARFSRYTFGNIWIILEPLVMIGMFMVLFGLRGRGEFGFVEPPVFVYTAFLPFRLLWNSTMRANMGAAGAVRGLMGFRQVKLFDVYLARSVVEGGVFLVSATVVGMLLWWGGLNVIPNDFLLVFAYCALFWLFAVSFGILASVMSAFSPEITKLINLMTMPLMFVSAVFFPMTLIPEDLHSLFAKNPILHAMELIREAWFEQYTSPVADARYLAAWTLGLLTLAISGYRLRWQRMSQR
ncbi:ABC transporter permease [Kordiimonas sp. SCSIO 12603]|uniref:ABC transporter permease n=1 Tax=Kordiimonas sp. SCSIO 12603 TaxID=2829596 RepID=UPI0021035C28|nr:ABC transporter permease [Kordiimonas sp. SCSIO 12603]UTW60035.1 ABC transporter permease [Kordiimonas sp. SCSIO 12603]